MTLSEVSSRLTPPEGWSEWIETKPHTEWVTRRTEPKEHIRITRHDDTFAVSVMTSEEMYHGPWTAARDLPAAYRRALTAVGLAPDAEKEDMRRRLTWTSEVPTEPGNYLVRWAETRGRPVIWTLDAGVWYGPSGSVCRPPPLGSSFLPLANLKEP